LKLLIVDSLTNPEQMPDNFIYFVGSVIFETSLQEAGFY